MLIRALTFATSLLANPVMACDVALVLAIDVSGSVDPGEYTLQMGGLAEALEDPAVAEALVRAKAQVMLIQWTGTNRQVVSIPWTEIPDHAAVTAFADQVATTPRRWRDFATAIGEAVALGITAFDAPEAADCARYVIDVSGDGVSNEGVAPEQIRVSAALRGITINAIAIEESEEGLTTYFRDNVITGPGAFAVKALTFEAYPERMKQKLLRELVPQLAANE